MLRICSPICSKTLLVTSHLNLQQPTWNIPSFAGKQYNFVLSDTIPCGYLHITNPLRRTFQTWSCAHAPQGHYLWNAGQVVSKYLQQHEHSNVRDKYVLELGAGAGLPSLVAAILGARRVVVTDYPDADLIANLNHNIANIAAPKDPTAIIRARVSKSFCYDGFD